MKTDSAYIAERDRLVPIAEKFANKMFGSAYKGPPGVKGEELHQLRNEWDGKWSLAFHRKMDRLYREAQNDCR